MWLLRYVVLAKQCNGCFMPAVVEMHVRISFACGLHKYTHVCSENWIRALFSIFTSEILDSLLYFVTVVGQLGYSFFSYSICCHLITNGLAARYMLKFQFSVGKHACNVRLAYIQCPESGCNKPSIFLAREQLNKKPLHPCLWPTSQHSTDLHKFSSIRIGSMRHSRSQLLAVFACHPPYLPPHFT